jgi:hypothetical protein
MRLRCEKRLTTCRPFTLGAKGTTWKSNSDVIDPQNDFHGSLQTGHRSLILFQA